MYTPIRDYGERLMTLTTDGYPDRAYILFCRHCDFQHESGAAGSMRCPNCRGRNLHAIGPVSDVRRFQTDPAYRAEQTAYR